MKRIVQIASVWLVAMAALAADSSASPVFQIRQVLDTPSAESQQMAVINGNGDNARKEVLSVQNKVLLDQTALKSAEVIADKRTGAPLIEIAFTVAGRKKFAEITRRNISHRLAIVIGGRLYSAPRIMAEIPGGKVQISGSFTKQEATELAAKITEASAKR